VPRTLAVLIAIFSTAGAPFASSTTTVDSKDPEVHSSRLQQVEDRASKLSDLVWRIIWAEFQPEEPTGFDLGCTLAINPWGLSNQWVVRELRHELIRARYPTGLDPGEDQRVADFFAQWKEGDRLFACAMPERFRTRRSGWFGYIIVRECAVVGLVTMIMV